MSGIDDATCGSGYHGGGHAAIGRYDFVDVLAVHLGHCQSLGALKIAERRKCEVACKTVDSPFHFVRCDSAGAGFG